MQRVAAIALDATEWSFVERLIATGRAPHLARLADRSAFARLRTETPFRSELPWTKFLTGRSGADLGYWGTEVFDPTTYDTWMQGAHIGDPFYAEHAERTVVFDIPHGSLSTSVEGLQVMSWGAHSPQYPRSSWPQGALREIDAIFGPHPSFDNDYDAGWFSPKYIDNLTEAVLHGAAQRPGIVRWLLDREPNWQFFLTALCEIHSAGHHFWHGIAEDHPLHSAATADLAGQRMLEVATAEDEAVGGILAELPEDAYVIVFAMHGMQPADDLTAMVLLPELFLRLNTGRRRLRAPDTGRWRRAGFPLVIPDSPHAWAVPTWLRHHIASGPRERALAAARAAVPRSLYEWVRRTTGRPPAYPLGELREPISEESPLTPAEIAKELRSSMDWHPASWYADAWPQMPWFALPTFTDGHVRINLVGRERDGIVDPADYDRTCDAIERQLAPLTDPRTGRPVIGEILRLRKDDPMDPDGPDADLLVVWSEAPDALEHPDAGVIGPVPYLRTGAHTANGFALISGPGIEPGDLGERPTIDLTPTIVELLGSTPEPAMRGTSMASALTLASRV